MPLEPISLSDIEARAKQAMAIDQWEFIQGGMGDATTTQRNRDALAAVSLRPRYLVDIRERDTSTTVLGNKISFPVMAGPAGRHSMAHPDAELATARATGAAGTLMVLATGSSYSMEEVSAAATGPRWFQLYHRGRPNTESLVHRAEEAGYSAICLTVDSVAGGRKDQDVRNRFFRESGATLGNFRNDYAQFADSGASPQEIAAWGPPGILPLAWSELEWLRSLTSLPLVVKGIRTAEDTRLCVDNGVEGIIVSNHGGRNFDATLSSIETLPEIVAAARDNAEIYMDSGIRRGVDVVRALALGARAVLVGRPIFWGLAIGGEEGFRSVLEVLRREFNQAMGHCGATTVDDINRSTVCLPGEAGWV